MESITILHLNVLIGTILPIPFGSLLLPYIYWRLRRNKESDLFSLQACNILNFQILFCIIFYVGMFVLWYVFLRDMLRHTMPDYVWMICPVAILFCVNIVYPIFIISRRNTEKKYYPTIIRFF